MTRDERLTKVRQCAGRVLAEDAVETLIETVEQLDLASSHQVLELVEFLGHSPASSS